MIEQSAFTVEPWCLRECNLQLDLLAQAESLFALSNGHIGWRGNLDEGEPHALPGSYLNGVYELRPLPYAEAGYGYPESGQTVINVTNGKLIRLLVDDEPFDPRYGQLRAHERELDFRTGLLLRKAEWVSPAGQAIRLTSTRLVSLSQRAVAAICYEVEAVDDPARIVVQSELVANEQLPDPNGDPRVAAALKDPLIPEAHGAYAATADLVHQTQRSGLRVAAAMDHTVEGPEGTRTTSESFPNLGRVTVTTVLHPGQRLRLIKFVAYGWSGERSLPALRDQVQAALTAANHTGWHGLCAEQRDYLSDFWSRADVEVDGDTKIQQAVRFSLFHVLQAGARAEQRAIPAKGLTGPGYDGHCFWDTETFVLPVLSYTVPSAAAHALRWRHSTMPKAAARARQLGLHGVAFPWRTIHGEECSSYWPAGTAAFHINADIADAVIRYVAATGDTDFEAGVGMELLVETARLWCSLGHHDAQGRFRIDGVTGPDEYSAVVDNNVYTNLMAQQNLDAAAALVEKHPDRARELGVNAEESARWRDAARAMTIPFDDLLGIHPQAEGFTRHQEWDFAATSPDQYPLLLHFPYFDLYRKQVVKQADLVLAMHLRGDAFTAAQKARNFAYYERLTVRDSSLSACTQAVVAAEVGHTELAYDYLTEAALMDLKDLENNTRDGLHIASLAGSWLALVAGLGGMRHYRGVLSFAPRLPAGLRKLSFSIYLQNQRLYVDIGQADARYTVSDSRPLRILHHGTPGVIFPHQPLVRPIPPPPHALTDPQQPIGREPLRRRRRRTQE
ncbi:glycoside hydrolase family 65 protein [Goodfellowiella coeruleoviolacea]|uniref:Alpha,alpha-trehalose phosphorylase n=1 Tax=Goodfellowiella coeruleoviolacea TaxID=334858 RepID=A0AAE3KJ93_9PSEU|nr:glycosyl hydrolase family 65 protein [Goodfellowiella coeruleoviolacea]MCP2164078.1 alpha,alpha-trehalose phosphorylase [Goodfellowiella coeruleoviolacea]